MKVTCQLIAWNDMFLKFLRISRQAEVGSESWRHKRGVWTLRTPTTCLEISEEKYVSCFD